MASLECSRDPTPSSLTGFTDEERVSGLLVPELLLRKEKSTPRWPCRSHNRQLTPSTADIAHVAPVESDAASLKDVSEP